MIPHMKPIKVHTTKYAKNGSSIMRNQNRSQNRRQKFFIARPPFTPNFMKPFYHFFATRQTCKKIPGGHLWQRLNQLKKPTRKRKIIPKIPTTKQHETPTTILARTQSAFIRLQNRRQNPFIARPPSTPNFMNPFYHFFTTSQETEVKPDA